jgi:hypothetical protein
MGVLSRLRPGQNRRYAYGFASILARNTSQVGYPNHTHFIGQTHPGYEPRVRLLRDLTPQNPAVFPQRAVLLTNAIGETLDEAIACSQQHGVPLWDKRSFSSPTG